MIALALVAYVVLLFGVTALSLALAELEDDLTVACRQIGRTEDPIYRDWVGRLERAWAAYEALGVSVADRPPRPVLWRKWWNRG